ncbi:hypothetical protein NliqN6_6733 [Naganishia liquefaciens]|uniref:intramembrane prenyl-peptidase Rce1 n=1 Tax=Naganishia liquefaciens TaxID=104408 RepID=A0A8H3TZ49_9TREE|nr:hypothetical protein NliqN6_6733 [Naganishia liquefaciens]
MVFSVSADLSPAASHLGAFALTLSYVGSLYLTKPERKRQADASTTASDSAPALDDVISQSKIIESTRQALDRDHPIVIKSRIRTVSVVTVGGIIGVGLTAGLQEKTLEDWKSALAASTSLLGLSTPRQILPYILAPFLFAGPLYTAFLERSLPLQSLGRQSLGLGSPERCDGLLDCLRVLWTRKKNGQDGCEKAMSFDLERRRWIEMRNYIAGPISEELMFRACIIAIYKLGGFSRSFLVFLSPLWFGLAHLHHAYDTYVKAGKTLHAALQAFVTSLFQFTYTTLFGWFAAHLFVKTGSIWPPMLAHVFCNMMGFPNPGYAMQQFPEKSGRIALTYVAGIVAFVVGLRQL